MKAYIHYFITSIIVVCACPAFGATYYVDVNHANASNNNMGTDSDLPWQTVSHAASIAGSGDTVLIKSGIYDQEPEDVIIQNSGKANSWITFKAFPGDEHQAIIRNTRIIGIGKSYIHIEGLKIEDSPNDGIRFEGPPDSTQQPATNIVIRNNHIHVTRTSSISIWGVSWGRGINDPGDYDNIRDVIIEHNLLEFGTNGGKNEIITVANGAVNIKVRFNEIRFGDGDGNGDEGIDFKEGVRDSEIYGNYIHDLADKGIYLDGGSRVPLPGENHGYPVVRNIRIYDNLLKNLPSSGIGIVTEGVGLVEEIYVYNNVVINVAKAGYQIHQHTDDPSASDNIKISEIYFYNNLSHSNGFLFNDYGFSQKHEYAGNIYFRNNIAWNNSKGGFKLKGANDVNEHNLCRVDGSGSSCDFSFDPLLDNTSLQLSSQSPAINMSIIDNVTPTLDARAYTRDTLPDLGPYELNGALPASEYGPAGLLITADNPQTLTFSASEDTYVNETSPNRNYGLKRVLVSDLGSQQTHGLIKFNATGITGSVSSAKIKFYVKDATTNGPAIIQSQSTWSELQVDWNTRPNIIGVELDNIGAANDGTWIEYDVTTVVTSDNTYSFTLLPDSFAGMDVSSREATRPPELIIEQQQ